MVTHIVQSLLKSAGIVAALTVCLLVFAPAALAATPLSDLNAIFRSVFDRDPTVAEWHYWADRLQDKPDTEALRGAMAFHKAHGRTGAGQVQGTKSNAVYTMRFGDSVSESAPGQLVTYSVTVTNNDQEGRALTPLVTVTAKNLEIPSVSDHGKRKTLSNGKLGGSITWDGTEIQNKKSHTFTFKVKTPGTIGSEYCVEASTFGLPLLSDTDCNKVGKNTSTVTSSASGSLASISDLNAIFRAIHGRNPTVTEWKYWASRLLDKSDRVALRGAMAFHKARGRTIGDAPSTATTASTAKTTAKATVKASDFKITGPDSLNTDSDDQDISWHVTDAVAKQYPGVKIEICTGKDFKSCIILKAVAENDGSQAINMPPVPRTGKWYLRLIGRDGNDVLRPDLQTSRLITLHQ